MKRIILIFTAVVMVALLSSCSIVAGALRKALPHATQETGQSVLIATVEPEATETEPVATETETVAPTAAPKVSIYTSETLGITFTVPDTWVGKYRVEEGDGYLTVFFNPAEPIDQNVGDGELFCIVKKTPDIDTSMYDNSQEFEVNGVAYIWGQPTDVRYSEGQPEYDTYVQMLQDFSAVYQSIRAAE
jgi:hypothetical protein